MLINIIEKERHAIENDAALSKISKK